LVAPKSATQSVMSMGGADTVELRQLARDYGSHSLNHGVEGGNCCGRGDVNEGPTWCTRKPPPMDGSKEDGQAGYTEKP
jgi:hypothetical protein